MDFYNKDLSSFFDESGKNYDPPLAEMKELLLSYLTPEIIKDKIRKIFLEYLRRLL